MWVNAGDEITMAPLDCTDADCAADFELPRDTRHMYPGIKAAAEKKTKGIVDSSIAGEFLSKVETFWQ